VCTHLCQGGQNYADQLLLGIKSFPVRWYREIKRQYLLEQVGKKADDPGSRLAIALWVEGLGQGR
jgi:hypothetical protein